MSPECPATDAVDGAASQALLVTEPRRTDEGTELRAVSEGQSVAPSRGWELHEGDSFVWLRSLPDDAADVCITDPPYSERQHNGVRSSRRGLPDGSRRVVDLGFAHFDRWQCAIVSHELARIVRRWSIVFCDDDLLPIWRATLRKAGLVVVRTMVWVRIGGAPQFSGDRPAAGAEYMVLAHRRTKTRWNGGGKPGVYESPIVSNRSGHRVHTTQKPENLLVRLVDDFTEPGELVIDPFAGSATTGAAALKRGRRFMGSERDGQYMIDARARLHAAANGQMVTEWRMKQERLFHA